MHLSFLYKFIHFHVYAITKLFNKVKTFVNANKPTQLYIIATGINSHDTKF